MTNPQTIAQGMALVQRARQMQAGNLPKEAAALYAQAMRLLPDHPAVLLPYAEFAEQVRDWKAAEKLYRRLHTLNESLGIEGKLAACLVHLGQYQQALPLIGRYLAKHPHDPAGLMLQATCHFKLEEWETALPIARRLWRTRQKSADIAAMLLSGLLGLGAREELDAIADEALQLFPDDWQVRKLAGEHLLKRGDYARGFPMMRQMRQASPEDRHVLDTVAAPWWDGVPFDGTLLVGAEQGLGDEIMISSVYPELLGTGQRVLIECEPRLLPVFRRSFPQATFVARKTGALERAATTLPGCRKIIGGDLLQFYRADRERFPARRQWLQAGLERVAQVRADYDARWGDQLRVGINWKSIRPCIGRSDKNIALAHFRPLLERPDTVVINLQYGKVSDDIATLGPLGERLYCDPDIDSTRDIDGLFAQVAALDLVVSSSSTVVHVAGSLGVPCWLLLPRTQPVLWYWGYTGERTPWYPSLRLVRNPAESDWAGLLRQVTRELDSVPRSPRQAPAQH